MQGAEVPHPTHPPRASFGTTEAMLVATLRPKASLPPLTFSEILVVNLAGVGELVFCAHGVGVGDRAFGHGLGREAWISEDLFSVSPLQAQRELAMFSSWSEFPREGGGHDTLETEIDRQALDRPSSWGGPKK